MFQWIMMLNHKIWTFLGIQNELKKKIKGVPNNLSRDCINIITSKSLPYSAK